MDLIGTGLSDYEIGRRAGVSRSSVQRWRKYGAPMRHREKHPQNWRPWDPASYSYLLGIYLGDGYISKADKSPVLEIALDSRYPGIADECSTAIWKVARAATRTQRRLTAKGDSIRVTASSSVWPTAFPQHGPGKKHLRLIALAVWQQKNVDLFPQEFLRGLIHSDGSRTINRFSVELAGGVRDYEYPRYFFTNLSADVRSLFCAACDHIGIHWTQSSHKNISIADRRSVALLDSFVGPKSDAGGGT